MQSMILDWNEMRQRKTLEKEKNQMKLVRVSTMVNAMKGNEVWPTFQGSLGLLESLEKRDLGENEFLNS